MSGTQFADRARKRSRLAGLAIVAGVMVASGLLVAWRLFVAQPASPKPLELRMRIVAGIAGETTIESVRRLHFLDDNLYAYTNVVNGPADRAGFGYLRVFVPALIRVRKILAEVDDANREEVTGALLDGFRDSVWGFGAAEREHRRRIVAAMRQRRAFVEYEEQRSEYSVKLSVAPATAYLLALLNVSKALPDMVAAYRSRERRPMDDPYLFYSMHLLMTCHPVEGLSEDARRALEAYRDAAKAVPELERAHGAAWNAMFDEWDFRTQFAGEGSLVRPRDVVDVARYPAAFVKMDVGVFGPSEARIDLAPLVDRIAAFVRLAYGSDH